MIATKSHLEKKIPMFLAKEYRISCFFQTRRNHMYNWRENVCEMCMKTHSVGGNKVSWVDVGFNTIQCRTRISLLR